MKKLAKTKFMKWPKYRTNHLKFLTLIFVVTTLLGFSSLVAPEVGADPPGSNQVKLHCIAVVASRARAACQVDKNISEATSVASHHCTKEPTAGGKQAACITRTANGYIDKANSNPRSPADFTRKLDAVLTKAGGDRNNPSAESQRSTTDTPANCKDDSCVDPAAIKCTQQKCDIVDKYVNPTINLLSLSFGVLAAASMIAGGIQYTMSAGDSQKVSLAKKRIFNTLLAVLAYLFMYAFLQFLVPGGIFNRGY